MLRFGCIVLTMWLVLNILPSAAIVVSTVFLGGHTPALNLLLTEDEVESLAPDVISTLDSIAVFANGLNLAFCAVALILVWKELYRRRVWAYWTLVGGFALALIAGVGADYEVGMAAPMVNLISGGILLLGLGSAGIALFRPIEADK